MPTITRRHTAGTVATLALTLLVAGCSGEASPPVPSATPQQTTTNTPTPTPTKAKFKGEEIKAAAG